MQKKAIARGRLPLLLLVFTLLLLCVRDRPGTRSSELTSSTQVSGAASLQALSATASDDYRIWIAAIRRTDDRIEIEFRERYGPEAPLPHILPRPAQAWFTDSEFALVEKRRFHLYYRRAVGNKEHVHHVRLRIPPGAVYVELGDASQRTKPVRIPPPE
jgi:hypothetical protein